jgi:hypothetical protein
MRPARIIAAVLLTAAAAAAGSYVAYSGSHPSAAASATTVAPTAAGTPASTTPATRVTTSTSGTSHAYPTHPTPAPTPRISDPALAATHLFDAWQAGDRRRALQAASPTAVRALLAIPPSPRPRFTGCRSRSLGYDCVYSYPNADGVFFIDMRVEGGASAGYRVVSIDAPLRFASPQTSARHLVDAWLAGDRAEARKAASATAVDALFSLGDRRHPPAFTACSYRNFGFDCAYTVQGGALTMGVTGGASVGWTVQTVTSLHTVDATR